MLLLKAVEFQFVSFVLCFLLESACSENAKQIVTHVFLNLIYDKYYVNASIKSKLSHIFPLFATDRLFSFQAVECRKTTLSAHDNVPLSFIVNGFINFDVCDFHEGQTG